MENKTGAGKVIIRILVPVIAVLLIVLWDYLVKQWALNTLDYSTYKPVIGNLIGFVLVKNEGMAWGMFQGKQWLFIIMTPIAIGMISYLYAKMPFDKKYIPVRIAEIMLMGGAVGNLVDRIFRGELFRGNVIDMIYVKCINFPVFNVADCFVSVGFAALIIMLLFVYKDEEFEKIISIKLFKKKEDE